MAVLKDGIFGGVRGRLGNTIYYMLNGKQVSRLVGRSTKPPTKKQLANRQAMKVTVDFLRPISFFIQTGFGLEAERRGMYPQNAAVGYNKTEALKGQYPDIEMDYAKVLVSKGSMPRLENPAVTLSGNAEEGFALWYSWDVTTDDQEWPRCNDEVMLLAYFPEVGLTDEEGNEAGYLDAKAYYKTDGARRKEGQDVLELPLSGIDRPMEVYIAVVAEDRKKIACSQYLGRITS